MTPQVLANPCWSREGVQNSLFNVANLSASHADYFLASHTPIRNIRDDRSEQAYTEEDLFQSLFDSSRNEVMGIIHGEPGSGKSHLIRWLKLRTDVAIEDGDLRGIRSVLVQRIAGSLKEALQQIIEQLGGDFARYLQPVKTALATLSAETARATLVAHLFLEVGHRRSDRGLAPLPLDLRDLPEFFNAPGTRTWLCRESGVIDKTIVRLTQPSEASDRQSLPSFSTEDFRVPERLLSDRQNPGVVETLGYDFLDRPELCEQAVQICNEVMPDALRSMTGLTGGILQAVLAEIRRDLFHRGQTLAVFIEDVSVWSALGTEVVNAFEPQSREGQCRMISVLGMVDSGFTSYQNLPVNQKQRATHIVTVGGDVLSAWRQDEGVLSAFAARYLNVVRLSHDQVIRLANQRRVGGDVGISACDECEVRQRCHSDWGAVDLGSTRIGLFPLTRVAPMQILNQLKDDTLHSPRGLVMHVLHPLLANPGAVPAQFPPDQALALVSREPMWWAGFLEKYCATWAERDRKRLRLLVQGWIAASNPSEAASQLQVFLDPLGLPHFTEAPVTRDAQRRGEQAPPTSRVTSPQPAPVNPKLQKILDDLTAWENPPHEMAANSEARELLFALIRDSINWEEDRDLPPGVRKKFLAAGKGAIEFAGQRARSAIATYRVQIPRSQETIAVVGALARFKYLGQQSWEFEDAEIHKRAIAQWLRANEESIRRQLKPSDTDQESALQVAVRFLALVSIYTERKKLTTESAADLMARLLRPEVSPTVAVSNEAIAFGSMLCQRRSEVIGFLLDELDAPQGTGACVFIDPVPILRTVKEDEDYTLLSFPSFTDVSRFRSLNDLAGLPSLSVVLDKERVAISETVVAIAASIECEDPEDSELLGTTVELYCRDLGDLRKCLEEVKFPIVDEEFIKLWKARVFTDSREPWANALKNARAVVTGGSSTALLLFDVTRLLDSHRCLRVAASYVRQVENELNDQVRYLKREGDPQELARRLFAHLTVICESGEAETK